MRFEFSSLNELKEFIDFINLPKDQIISQEAKTLNKASGELKKAVDNSFVQEKKND